MAFISLLLVLLVVGLIVFLIIALLMAESLLHPPRMNDGKALYLYKRLSPSDLNLPYIEVTFTVPAIDQPGKSIDIAGWWIEAPTTSERCVVLIHGYADARISAIGWAPLCRALGWNVLAIDLRAHGESGGRSCTAGVREADDIAVVLSQLQTRFAKQSRELVLFGISMGATVAAATAMRVDDQAINLAGVIIESPFDDFVTTARHSTDLRGMPSGIIFTLAVYIAQRWTKVDYATIRSSSLLPRITSPVLWLHGSTDRIVDDDQRAAIRNAMEARRQPNDRIAVIADADHLLGIAEPNEDAVAAITGFLKSLSISPPAPTI